MQRQNRNVERDETIKDLKISNEKLHAQIIQLTNYVQQQNLIFQQQLHHLTFSGKGQKRQRTKKTKNVSSSSSSSSESNSSDSDSENERKNKKKSQVALLSNEEAEAAIKIEQQL